MTGAALVAGCESTATPDARDVDAVGRAEVALRKSVKSTLTSVDRMTRKEWVGARHHLHVADENLYDASIEARQVENEEVRSALDDLIDVQQDNAVLLARYIRACESQNPLGIWAAAGQIVDLKSRQHDLLESGAASHFANPDEVRAELASAFEYETSAGPGRRPYWLNGSQSQE